MFAYCENDPTMCTDYFGFAKTAIIYENCFAILSSTASLGYSAVAYTAFLKIMSSDDIVPLPFASADEFVDAWSSLDSSYDSVIIIVHGYTSGGGIWCRDGDIRCSGNSTYLFSDLLSVDLQGRVVLYSCHSTRPDHNGDTVAQAFANLSGSPVVGADGTVTITPFGAMLEDGDSWVTIKPQGGTCPGGSYSSTSYSVMMIK